MSQLKEYIKIAWMSIKSNKGRSLLTMLGIIIGISSVIMIMSVGNGVKNSVVVGLDDMFGGQLYIYSQPTEEVKDYVEFDNDDLEAIRKKVEHIKGITPEISFYGSSNSIKGDFVTYIYMGSPDYQYASKEPLLHGRYFSWDEYEEGLPVCVIQEQSAINLFGTSDVVGETFELTIEGIVKDVKIVGVRAKSESAMKELTYVYDDVEIDMPMSAYETITGDNYYNTYSRFLIIADSPNNSTQVTKDTVQYLEARKDIRGLNLIQTNEFSTYADTIKKVVNYITVFIAFVAAISLLVGGIGVMNIMLVSVTERTREIGIRKSLGARTASILTQFLAEAAMITLIGGILGMLIGWLGALALCGIVEMIVGIHISATLSIGAILGVSLFSSAVGIFFGMYPAKKAADLSPIEALRRE